MAGATPAGLRFDQLVVGALAGIAAVGAALAGHPIHGALAAVALWFGADWITKAIVAQKTATAKADADAPDRPLPPDLQPVLAQLEATRVRMAAAIERRTRIRLPLGLAAGVLFWTWLQFDRDPPGLIVLGILAAIGALGGWAWASGAISQRYREMYKAEVLPRLAASFGELTYRPAERPDAATLRQQRLFRTFDRVGADDEIVGRYCGVPLSIVELRLDDTRGKNAITVFDGLFARIELPRRLAGTTAVIADAGLLGGLHDLWGERAASRVRIESPAFEQVYQVHGTDQIGARALLTPAFVERFMTLGERTGFGRPLALAQGNQLTIVLPKQGMGDLFEPPDYAQPATSRAALAKLHDDLQAVLNVADAVVDLDQSVRARPWAGDETG